MLLRFISDIDLQINALNESQFPGDAVDAIGQIKGIHTMNGVEEL